MTIGNQLGNDQSFTFLWCIVVVKIHSADCKNNVVFPRNNRLLTRTRGAIEKRVVVVILL